MNVSTANLCKHRLVQKKAYSLDKGHKLNLLCTSSALSIYVLCPGGILSFAGITYFSDRVHIFILTNIVSSVTFVLVFRTKSIMLIKRMEIFEASVSH